MKTFSIANSFGKLCFFTEGASYKYEYAEKNIEEQSNPK